MSFSIHVLVLNQEKPINLDFESQIELQNEKKHKINMGRYYDMWPFLMKQKGILYLLCIDHEGVQDSYPICYGDFKAKNIKKPYWIYDQRIRSHLVPFLVKPEYRFDFEKIIRFLIDKSPEKTIFFHTRFQGGDDEIICGTLSLPDFFAMLDHNRILFNVCYILQDNL